MSEGPGPAALDDAARAFRLVAVPTARRARDASTWAWVPGVLPLLLFLCALPSFGGADPSPSIAWMVEDAISQAEVCQGQVRLKPVLQRDGQYMDVFATKVPRGADSHCDAACCFIIEKPAHVGLISRHAHGHYPHLPDPTTVDMLVHLRPHGAGYLFDKPDSEARGRTKATVHCPLPGQASYPTMGATKVAVKDLKFIVDRDTLLLFLSKAHTIMGVPPPSETHYSVERAKITAFKKQLVDARAAGLSEDAHRRLLDHALVRFNELSPTISYHERATGSVGVAQHAGSRAMVEAKSALQLAEDNINKLSADDRRSAVEPFRAGLGAAFCPAGQVENPNPSPEAEAEPEPPRRAPDDAQHGPTCPASRVDSPLTPSKLHELFPQAVKDNRSDMRTLHAFAVDALAAWWKSSCPSVDSLKKDFAKLSWPSRGAPPQRCRRRRRSSRRSRRPSSATWLAISRRPLSSSSPLRSGRGDGSRSSGLAVVVTTRYLNSDTESPGPPAAARAAAHQ